MLTEFVEWEDGKPYSLWCVLIAAVKALPKSPAIDLHIRMIGGLYGRGVHSRSLAKDEMYTPRETIYANLSLASSSFPPTVSSVNPPSSSLWVSEEEEQRQNRDKERMRYN